MCEELLQVILQDEKLKVIEVIPQKSIKNLQGRSVRLDALCIRGNGEYCNIEVQRAGNEHHFRRVRYNTSCITANITEPGDKFENVPDVSSVYISEFDIFKDGKTIYHVRPTVGETGKIVDNGLQEVYVNTEINDGSEISELMQCFLQTEVNNEKFPKLSKRMYYFKHNEEGIKYMSSVSEEIREEGRQEEREIAIINMLKKFTPEEIVKLGYDEETVMRIAKK